MDEAIKTNSFEKAKYLKVRRQTYKEDLVDVYKWIITTYFKANNSKFEILENTKRLNNSINSQLISGKEEHTANSNCNLL